MLPAKLFGVLAVIFAILAGLSRVTVFPVLPVLDVPLRSTYLVMDWGFVLLFCGLTSANFAVLYYAGNRIFHAHWNRRLTFLHVGLFLFFSVSLPIGFALMMRTANIGDLAASMRWITVLVSLGILSLVASLVVFGINLILTVVQIVRARFASH